MFILGFLDNGQYIVLCTTKQQTKAFSELAYMEIDMAFKRIHGITNEWEVSAYIPRIQKSKLIFFFYFYMLNFIIIIY